MTRIRPASAPSRIAHQRGIALFVGLVFLIVLSLVAVIAMQSTLLEMRMVTNVARQAEAFQMSESGRSILTAPPAAGLFAQNIENAGWPVSWGGEVPDADFDFTEICKPLPAPCQLVTTFENSLIAGPDGRPKLLYGALDPSEDPAKPSTWVTDATINWPDPQNASDTLTAALSVVPDGSGANAGAGAAQAAGYRGLGVGLAGGGAGLFFQIQSVGTSPANGRAVTIAQYRAVVQ